MIKFNLSILFKCKVQLYKETMDSRIKLKNNLFMLTKAISLVLTFSK